MVTCMGLPEMLDRLDRLDVLSSVIIPELKNKGSKLQVHIWVFYQLNIIMLILLLFLHIYKTSSCKLSLEGTVMTLEAYIINVGISS